MASFIQTDTSRGYLRASIPNIITRLEVLRELGQQLDDELRHVLESGGRADKLLFILRLSPKMMENPEISEHVQELSVVLYLWIMQLKTPSRHIFHEIFPSFYRGPIKVWLDEGGERTLREGQLTFWIVVDGHIRLRVGEEVVSLPLSMWTTDRKLIMFDKLAVCQTLGVLWDSRGLNLFEPVDQDGNYLIAT
ncbi:hypothetical protein LTR41_010655 [Exophiala xenobiotica]|nr:hypothetical protein LTR41_010655 [Exophiala xenobiotica]